MVERTALLALCDGLLKPEKFKDYCPNGLQVEGRPDVKTIASGVTASLAFIQAAIDAGADTLLAYHLPLDAHASLGNNAQLASHLGFLVDSTFGEQALGFVGQPQIPIENAAALTHAFIDIDNPA